MGLMLSLLIGCAGIVEAIACYQTIRYGLLPKERPSLDELRTRYDSMVAESLSKSSSPSRRSEAWKIGAQGYLEVTGGRGQGPIRAQIKYLGAEDDPTPLLFSTKISSFGQESQETAPPTSQGHGYSDDSDYRASPRLSPYASADNVHRSSGDNFWGEEEEEEELEEEPKEKIQWHYRPLTPINNNNNNNNNNESSLPEIHFDSYERRDDGDEAVDPDDFLRSDGVKFRPLKRDDGTGRRRSFKKRHSSSSTSSRESKASREEELRVFTSLEESEFESYNNNNHHQNGGVASQSSVNSLSAEPLQHQRRSSKSKSKSKSRDRSSRSPSLVLNTAESSFEGANGRRSPSAERPLLGNLPKHGSFDEEFEDASSQEPASSTATGGVNESRNSKEGDDSTVVFRRTGVNE